MDVSNKLISEEEIQQRVIELAKKIEQDYKGKEIYLIGVLKGASVFIADLMRHINLDVKLDFMSVSSYGMSTTSSGIVKILKDVDQDISARNVIIVEDIVDTGLTLNYLKEYLLKKEAKSIKICTLLDKPERRKCKIDIDYVGFEIEDKFIVGYGIDYKEMYRNLPYISYVTE